MAYSGKIGLDYFPLDVGFFEDDKIELIEAEFGPKGIVIALKLLCKVYKEGGFYKWGDDECLLFSKRAGAEVVPSFVREVVMGLVRRSFFDKKVFDSFQVLTSKGIQKRYFEAAERRKSISVIGDYLLIDVSQMKNVNIVGVNANILTKNVDIFRQRKVKESKGKKRRVNKMRPLKKVKVKTSQVETTGLPPPPVAPPPSFHVGFFPNVDNLDMDLPDMRIGMEIQRVRYTKQIAVNEDQVTGLWEIFKKEYFTGKKHYKDADDVYRHFGNWLEYQKFSNGTVRKSTTTKSINAVNSAFADIQRDLDEAVRRRGEDQGH